MGMGGDGRGWVCGGEAKTPLGEMNGEVTPTVATL